MKNFRPVLDSNHDNLHTSCRILYSTRSGRARACARRTARILAQAGGITLQNGKGSAFDQDYCHYENNNSNNNTAIVQMAQHLRESQTLLIVFVSTTGDGEHTETIQKTWSNLLKKSLPSDTFLGVQFCTFSLGDRAYGPQKYCAAGRKLTVRLRQLGASLVGNPGFGDDGTPQGGVFYDLDQWLGQTLMPLFKVKPGSALSAPPLMPSSPPYQVKVSSPVVDSDVMNNFQSLDEWQLDRYAESYRSFFQKQRPLNAYTYSNDDRLSYAPLVALVTENYRLTANDWEQNTRHLRLKVVTDSIRSNLIHKNESSQENSRMIATPSGNVSLPYRAGDVAAIFPSNSIKEVEAFLKVLPSSLQDVADCELSIDYIPPIVPDFLGHAYAYWPHHCTLRGWLRYCADLHSLPEREDLRALATFCSEQHPHGSEQINKLMALSETKGSPLYADYILREKRSWVHVLHDFDSLRDAGSRLTLDAILGLLPPLRYREFSIASSPTKESIQSSSRHGEISLELCVAVVEGTTRLGRNYHGLCSYYLGQLDPSHNDKVLLWIRPGSFHSLPLDISENGVRPVIYIGAGTGIAPLRALIHERAVLLPESIDITTNNNNEEYLNRDDILVFGCRKQTADYYYAEEWEAMEKSGKLAILTAFSRDQWHKYYVQQALEKNNQDIALIPRHILERSGSIYIAGGPKMARAVKDVIVQSLIKEFGGDEKHALRLLTKMQQEGRFCVEAWS